MNRKLTHYIGIDIGQSHDYTAITVMKQVKLDKPQTLEDWFRDGEKPKQDLTGYAINHLERLELGMSYPRQVERIMLLVDAVRASLKPSEAYKLILDATGVGKPIVDMLRDKGLKPVAIFIHGGDAVTQIPGGYRVPKREIASSLQVLLQTRRLKVSSSLPEAENLVRELQGFKVSISKTGHDSYGNDWRENPHDDLVLSVGVAAWYADRKGVKTDLESLKAAIGY